MRHFVLPILCIVALSACSTASERAQTHAATEIKNGWWLELDDPLLNGMADNLSKKNLDIAQAVARLDEARAIRRATQSDLFPSVDLTAGASRGKRDRAMPSTQKLEAGFDATWELDVFGGTRAAIRGAKASENFALADIEDVKQTLIADLARAVTEWRLAVEQKTTIENLLKAQSDQIEIFAAREKAGLSDATLTERARAQRAQSAVQLPLFAAAAQRSEFQMERLMGFEPYALASFLEKQHAKLKLPIHPTGIFNVSASLIQDRPDIRKATAQINLSKAEVAQATAALFPSISLNSFFGGQDISPSMGNNPVWNVGASLATPLFRFGKLKAAIDAADAREKQALLNYQNVTLKALQEIQTALSDYLNGLEAITRQQEALIRRMDTTELAKTRFTRGITNMTDLTTAQAEQEQAALNLVQQKADTVIAYIRLQKALGMSSNGGDAASGAAQTPAPPQTQD